MSLTIDLSLSISSDRTTATITDNTVYGTGGNPARSAVACFLTAYKVDGDGNETELAVTSDDNDPETDSVWTITLSEDGYYKFPFVIIPDFNSSSTYNIYDAVFNSSDDKVFRSKTNSNTEDTLTNTTYFEEITDPSDLANNKDTSTESENITSQVYIRVLSPNSQYEFSNQLSNLGNYMDADDTEFSLGDYNLFAQWLDAVAVADSRSEVLDGELICRRIQSKFID
jgi:hypothetical protein